jgi:DNA-binding transcriptional MerR regulator
MANLTTADIAKAGRTTVRGVHIWEGRGLLGPVSRDRFGAREFTREHVDRAKLIAAAQMAGMSLAEILAAFDDPRAMTALHNLVEDTMIFLRLVQDSIYTDYDL